MSSRKRNKGKAERKAKQVENERVEARNAWQNFARGVVHEEIVSQCDHGFGVMMQAGDNHPLSIFMDTYFINWNKKLGTLENALLTYNKHPEVWKDYSYRKMAINILLCIGTNLILGTKPEDGRPSYVGANYLIDAILLLEQFNGESNMDSVVHSRDVATKRRDLLYADSGVIRDELKFYSKRISCSCLKGLYSKARETLPKLGSCYGCGEVKERASFMVCSRCRIHQYCSRECQVKIWPTHQEDCDILVHFHEQHTKCGRSNTT